MKRPLLWISLVLTLVTSLARADGTPPGLEVIRTEDLRSDLFALAGARFKGRAGGTIDELRAAAWIAERYKAIGLEPAGDDGSYFQFFSLWRHELSERSTIEVSGQALELWREVAVPQLVHTAIDAPIVYLGDAAEVDLGAADVAGKVVAMAMNPTGINFNMSLPSWRYHRALYMKYGLPLVTRGARAIVFVADEAGENAWADAVESFKLGLYDIDGGSNATITARAPVFWLRASAKPAIQTGGATLKANLIVSRYAFPSVNIIGRLRGTDSALRSEHLLYSGHTDAHGVRNPIKGDTIYYGADDNASVNVAMLACARALVQHPPRRSVLFVIHGAEERGLLGSKHFVAHPTVPLHDIVTVLNGDMIGRNAPGQAALLGSIPPHRNSADLVAMALAANREGPNFTLDETWDDVKHAEGWYFRSDHLPYARLGIPAVMYSTLLHADYHTPQDNAENIDYAKLTQMTEWMYRTGWKVANADQRPRKDENFQLER